MKKDLNLNVLPLKMQVPAILHLRGRDKRENV